MMIVKIHIRIIYPTPDKLIHHVVIQDIRIYSAIIDPAVVPRLYRNKTVGKSFKQEVFLKAHSIIMVSAHEIYRSLPVIVGKYVKNNELAFKYRITLKSDVNIRNYFSGIFRPDCTRSNNLCGINGYPGLSLRV